ncbi:MAG: LamG domain-containing protein [Lentisphaeria bacterium]|nr:LamG domain-containing protein [Lentisphaeria bacterium]
MEEHAHPDFLLNEHPCKYPNLICGWEFEQNATSFTSQYGETYTLSSQTKELKVLSSDTTPLTGKALKINAGDWLSIPRSECPKLDIHGPRGHFTMIAWVKREKSPYGGCEFIAGRWNESNKGRQYGLFLNIGVWQQLNQVTGHLSNVGGPTPGYKYCIDGPVSKEIVEYDTWQCIAFTYDCVHGAIWLNGQLDARPTLNPYSMPGGLHDSGPNGSDFTVGAVDRSGEIGNFFTGEIAGLFMYDRVLSPAEIYAIAKYRH